MYNQEFLDLKLPFTLGELNFSFSRSLKKLFDLKIWGAYEIPRAVRPIPSKAGALIKKSLKEKIPIINRVEKGREHAITFTAKLISKVGSG